MNTCFLQERFASDSLFVESYRTACRLFDVCNVLLLRVLEIKPAQLLYLDHLENTTSNDIHNDVVPTSVHGIVG